ncbi:MAG TPA: nickel-binding protein [Polyangia bacterium]|nr:nickel-binding protein [Polyangia bacterium]
MRNEMLIGMTMLAASGTAAEAKPVRATPDAEPSRSRLFLDEHDLGPGKVTAAAVAEAHKKDLATQAKHGVHYHAYWLDEKQGKIYCLVEAPSAEAAAAVHREAHGLVANDVREVAGDSADWTPAPGQKLFLDRHHFGPGKVTAADVAAAHRKDLAVQARHHARFLNYWFDPASGTVSCLVEAPTAADAVAAHKEAHGLVPDAIDEVTEGR